MFMSLIVNIITSGAEVRLGVPFPITTLMHYLSLLNCLFWQSLSLSVDHT